MDNVKLVIADKLSDLGLNMAHKGFAYIVDALMLIDRTKQMYIYRAVARDNDATASQVERCMRTCITSFYDDHAVVPPLFKPSAKSGSLTVGEFLRRAQQYVWRNTGMLEDGTCWALFDIDDINCVVRFYADKGNYDAFKGSRPQCVVYLKNLLKGVG